MHLMDMTSVNC